MNPKGQAEAKALRAPKALELKIAGGSYRQIGKHLGVSAKTAYQDVQDALAQLDTVKLGKAERLRDLDLERCDRAIVGLSQGVGHGDPRAVTALMRVLERRAKLLGLDAPTKLACSEGEPLTAFTLILDRPFPGPQGSGAPQPPLELGPNGERQR